MQDYKFNTFTKGWYFKQRHLIGLDGFDDINNFVVYKHKIDKVRGWKKLPLTPFKFSDVINSFNQTIDDFNFIIDFLNDSAINPVTLVEITYPLTGPNVQSIFEYLKFEEENIHLGRFGFDYIHFYGLPPGFDWHGSVPPGPGDEPGPPPIEPPGDVPTPGVYGLIKTCDVTCDLPEFELTLNRLDLIFGPAIKISSTSTFDNATLYAAIYNPFDNTFKLVKYINQSVQGYGAILESTVTILIIGDVIRIREISPNTYNIQVYRDGLLFVNGGDIVDNDINDLNSCFGVVQLATPGA